MKELVILAALVSALHAASLPTDTDVVYKCQEDQDKIATLEAESFINDHHRHGYKFKFVSLDSRSADEKTDPCGVILGITLEETECHIVNPKPLDQCNTRMETETKVTAKCNVTISSVDGKVAVNLVPLHDPKALESVKTALQKFNKEFNHKWTILTNFFADFAIMETNCTNKEEESCKALCGDQRYGFCKSSKVGNEEPEVECEIFEAQNITHPMKHPAQSRKDCKFHGRPGHAGHDHKDKTPDHSGHPEHGPPRTSTSVHLCPKGPSGVPESAPEGRHEFPCHGFVKIPPSIYPICPFPPPRLCRSPPDLVIPGPPPPSPQ
uniref:Alpha-2-HS-glycoprotein 1 n=1 Tax=Cyprinus carpio TaxID=7962 RepID=A0A8C2G9G2_CYPCA